MRSLIPLVALLIAGPAFAQAAAPAPAADTPAQKPVCRREAASTGSVMPGRRVCKTAEEWKAIDIANAENDQTRDRRNRQLTGQGGLRGN